MLLKKKKNTGENKTQFLADSEMAIIIFISFDNKILFSRQICRYY